LVKCNTSIIRLGSLVQVDTKYLGGMKVLVTLESLRKCSPNRDMEGGTRDGACTEPVGGERVTLCEYWPYYVFTIAINFFHVPGSACHFTFTMHIPQRFYHVWAIQYDCCVCVL